MGSCSHRHHRKCKKCRRKCVGIIKTKYKIYENCCNDIMKGCPSCGCEYHHPRYYCPKCGLIMDNPPRFGGFSRPGGRFGEFGEHRFGGFPFGFSPDFDEFEEDEDCF